MTADYETTVPMFGNLYLLDGLQHNGSRSTECAPRSWG